MKLLFVLLALSVSLGAHAQSAWTVTRTNLPGAGGVNGLAYGKGRFVVTVSGPSGSGAAWSTDASTWRDFTPLPSMGRGLFFLHDTFYNISDTIIHRSSDGVTWNILTTSSAGAFYTAAASDGTGFLIVTTKQGNDSSLLLSRDLVTWRATAPLPNSPASGQGVTVNHLAFGAGRYWVNYFANLGTGTPAPATVATASTVDGTTWTVHPDLAFASGLAGNADRFVAIAGAKSYATTNGTTFTSAPLPDQAVNPAKLHCAGGRFFIARSLFSSADGLAWAPLGALNTTANPFFWDATYGNGRYVAGGFTPPPQGADRPFSDVVAVIQAPGAPLISTQPVSRSLLEGQRATFSVTVEDSTSATTYQWRRDGVVLPGATSASYTIDSVTLASTARFTVEVRNALGSATSEPADLTVVPVGRIGRIINLSVLTTLDTPDATVTAGFVVGGSGTSGTKFLLVRAGGPSLSQFGVDRPNPDPRLALVGPAGPLGTNDNWAGSPLLLAAASRVGAFPYLSPDSKDAALFANVARGDYTARVSATATGSVNAEIYDSTPDTEFTLSTPRLINISVLKPLAAHASISAGFVLGGSTPRTVLIRAVGPSLAGFGVTSPLADPRLILYRSDTPSALATNDDWAGAIAIRDAAVGAGAFALIPGSKDAALLISLTPGNYTAQAFADSIGGSVLVEIYEIN